MKKKLIINGKNTFVFSETISKVLNELGFITEKPYELLNNNYSKNLQNTKVYNFKIK